jgi:hypothetical protein
VTGIVLLLAALGVAAVLAAVLVAAVRARLAERARSAAEAGGESAGSAEGGAAAAGPLMPPALKPWLACSGVAVVVLVVLAMLWLKGCEAIGRARAGSENRELCRMALDAQWDWFGKFWDKHKRLPSPEELGVVAGGCPLGHPYAYIGNLGVSRGGSRVLLVETDAHEDGSRRALTVAETLLSGGKNPGSRSGLQPVANHWEYHSFFQVIELGAEDFEDIRARAEAAAEKGGK